MEKIALLKCACIILVVCMAVAAPAQSFTTLHNFDGTDGTRPSGLIQATDGNIYGTTGSGMVYVGTVFKITPEGTLTTLYSFCAQMGCPDGAGPNGLIQASDGNFYGTTSWGGTSGKCQLGCGTVFKITPTGTLTTLYSFCAQMGCPDGYEPRGKLVQATDGNFYGTTSWGGASSNCYGLGCGTVFQITPTGTLTILHSFDDSDGAHPYAGLVEGADGNFYGTTHAGAATGGTVFKITPSGTLTTLHSFYGNTGFWPCGELIQARDGNLYGTTQEGGAHNAGVVFKITPSGTLTTLYSFCSKWKCLDGIWPSAGLVQATDENFYGTTEGVGAPGYGYGTVFEIAPRGTLQTLHTFDSTDGAEVGTGVVQATDGSFYGTTWAGGANGYGTVYHLVAAPALTLSAISLRFGKQALNETSVPRTVSVKDSGTALLNINGIAVDGSGFAISTNTCRGATLGIGKTCNVSVTFTPTVPGTLTGTLTFTDNASDSPQTVSLSGTGVPPATLTPASGTYAAQAVGTTSTAKIFTLTNNQSVTLTSIAISTTGDFVVSSTSCSASLAAKGKCTISVTFTPTALGKRAGTLSVSDSASNSPQTAALTGTGVEPATLLPLNASFGGWALGTTSTAKTFTLTNNQIVALTSIAISTTGDFAVSATTCTTSLAARSKCTISVTFTPTALGQRTGALTVSDSASNSPQKSNLTGTGT